MSQYATAEELCAILGPRWAICRNTPKNRERYGRCITRKIYENAQKEAFRLRLSKFKLQIAKRNHVHLTNQRLGQ